MSQQLFNLASPLTEMPFNIWLWLIPVTAPLLIFNIKHNEQNTHHLIALAAAIILTYGLMLLSIQTKFALAWDAYYACYAEQTHLRDMSPERSAACKHHLQGINGFAFGFAVVLGWIPAMGYVGLWEWVWRWRYRKKHKEPAVYVGYWFGIMAIVIFIAQLIFFLLLLAFIFYKLFSKSIGV